MVLAWQWDAAYTQDQKEDLLLGSPTYEVAYWPVGQREKVGCSSLPPSIGLAWRSTPGLWAHPTESPGIVPTAPTGLGWSPQGGLWGEPPPHTVPQRTPEWPGLPCSIAWSPSLPSHSPRRSWVREG